MSNEAKNPNELLRAVDEMKVGLGAAIRAIVVAARERPYDVEPMIEQLLDAWTAAALGMVHGVAIDVADLVLAPSEGGVQ